MQSLVGRNRRGITGEILWPDEKLFTVWIKFNRRNDRTNGRNLKIFKSTKNQFLISNALFSYGIGHVLKHGNPLCFSLGKRQCKFRRLL